MSHQAPQNIDQEHRLAGTSGEAKIQSDAEAKHLIFLSHSGSDKPFVRNLYNALRDAGHDPFFDTHSLPAGEPFPNHIFQNASGCRLGVVVLSPDFLTSRWPMMELHTMHTSVSAPTILPLFFKVTPNDVKDSSPRFAEWRNAWHTLAMQSTSRVNLTEWEAATKNLSILNGVVYEPDKGEDIFIEKTLRHICSRVRPPLRYMVSHLTGCERLTQEVAALFEEFPSSSHFQAQAIGLHGIGGQGKTTICKLMINHYLGAYAGRCTLILFSSDECQEAQSSHVLGQCKKALRQLTNISEDRISYVDDLDQCLQLLKEEVAGRGVFIAMDNIWEKDLECAQRIVDVGFNKESKILVMSRSREVLISLLKDSRSVRTLPSLNIEEARQILLNSFNRNHGAGLRFEESEVDKMTGCFEFEHKYHPLAIHALGMALGRMDRRGRLATWDQMLHVFRRSNDNVVTKALKKNYDSTPKTRRDLFLDVALIYIPMVQRGHVDRILSSELTKRAVLMIDYFNLLHIWLSALYKGRIDEPEIIMTLNQLTLDGLLEFEDRLGRGREEVCVHDLYRDLAIQEGVASGRYVVGRENIRVVDNIKYADVERIVLEGDKLVRGEPNLTSLPNLREALPNLQLLMARNWDCRGWRLQLMPGLQILQVGNEDGESIELVGWKNTPHLAWLELKSVTCEDILNLSDLLVLGLEDCSLVSQRRQLWSNHLVKCTQLCLNRLVNLQALELVGVIHIEEIMGLGSLVHLKHFSLARLPHLRKVGNFGQYLTQLRVLMMAHCDLLEDVQGDVGLLPNLKVLSCTDDILCKIEPWMFNKSRQAFSLEDVREAPPKFLALEFLVIKCRGGEPVVGVHALPRLKVLNVVGPEVKEIASMSQLPSLEEIWFHKYIQDDTGVVKIPKGSDG